MIENTILSNLVHNEDFCRKVFPYIKVEYFEDANDQKLFETYADYVSEYRGPPSVEALKISLGKRTDLNEEGFEALMAKVSQLAVDPNTSEEWLLKETEEFCQKRALYNAIFQSIRVMDGREEGVDTGAIPQILTDALGVSFDTHIGHDFLEDFEDRFDFYHRKEERVSFDLEIFNKITKGGLAKKSLTVLLAETGAGKTLTMCHMAAANLMHGKNVLYITLEMAEERILERIDANLLDVTLDELNDMPREQYQRRMARLKGKTPGKLIAKEYPTGSANAGHIRHLLNELRLKKSFTPDILYVDYLNLMSSSRIKGANSANTYVLVKSIAEELRGLAMEFGIPIVSATQANRSGYGNSDLDLTNTSESIGLPQTVDAMFAIMTSEDLERMGQLMVKQLKNRWGDLSYYRRFVVGIDRSKMKLFNLEESAQDNLMKDDDGSAKATLKSSKPSFGEDPVLKSKKTKFQDAGDLIS